MDDWLDDAEEAFTKSWNQFCNAVEKYGGKPGRWISQNVLRRLVISAPVLLGFVLVCSIVFLLELAFPQLRRTLGVHDSWNWNRMPLQITSLFTHIFAHADFNHLKGNMTHLLLVGPAVEHAFGSGNLIIIIVVVALASAAAHIAVGGNRTHQLGASGVVFAFIILSSLVSAKYGKIPVSFLIVTGLYLGDEFIDFFFAGDATSHHAHLVGGIVGGMAGFYIHKQKKEEKMNKYINRLKSLTSSKKKS